MKTAAHVQTLIEAGLRLAERVPLEQVNSMSVAAEAGLQPGDFDTAFGGLEQYLNAVQGRFMDSLRTSIIAATADLPSGYERAQKGALAYLDGCLARPGLRGWLLRARLQYPALAAGLHTQNQGYLQILPPEFAALRWPYPQAGARLFLAALQEIAQLEHVRNRVSSELRNALWQFLRIYERR